MKKQNFIEEIQTNTLIALLGVFEFFSVTPFQGRTRERHRHRHPTAGDQAFLSYVGLNETLLLPSELRKNSHCKVNHISRSLVVTDNHLKDGRKSLLCGNSQSVLEVTGEKKNPKTVSAKVGTHSFIFKGYSSFLF